MTNKIIKFIKNNTWKLGIATVVISILIIVLLMSTMNTDEEGKAHALLDTGAGIALIVGLLSFSATLYTNQKNQDQMEEHLKLMKYSIDIDIAKKLSDLDVKLDNDSEIQKFAAIKEFKDKEPAIFRSFFKEFKDKDNEIFQKNYINYINEITEWLLLKDSNEQKNIVYLLWYYFMDIIMIGKSGFHGYHNYVKVLDPHFIFNEKNIKIEKRTKRDLLLKENVVKEYINGGYDGGLGIPNDPDGTTKTKEKFTEFYESFLEDITDFNKEFIEKLDKI